MNARAPLRAARARFVPFAGRVAQSAPFLFPAHRRHAVTARRSPLSMLSAAAAALLCATAAWGQQAGDSARGKALSDETCIACHGPDGNGPVAMFPKLAGQHAPYLAKQLQDFASGRRDSDIMKPIVASLSAADMADVSVFFASQQPTVTPTDPPPDAATLSLGKRIYDDGDAATGVPACAGCHGANGIGNTRYPRLAGQHSAYLLDQMQRFASGQRSNDKRLMQTVASRLGADETRAVAEYIASLELKP